MRLAHLHLPKPIPYSYAKRLQSIVFLEHQKQQDFDKDHIKNPVGPEPSPTLLTFQTEPTYTVGRGRYERNGVSKATEKYLTTGVNEDEYVRNAPALATFDVTKRGGLVTYHGPGQLTAFLILTIKKHALGPRKYVELLEQTVMNTCRKHGVPNVSTTSDTGVWVTEPTGDLQQIPGQATNRKICAIGVGLGRRISTQGLALNIYDQAIDLPRVQKSLYVMPTDHMYTPQPNANNTDGTENSAILPAPGYLSWGFSRIVACGLDGKRAAWLADEQARNGAQNQQSGSALLNSVADTLAKEFAYSLKNVEGVEKIEEDEILCREQVSWDDMRQLSGTMEDPRRKDMAEMWSTRYTRDDNGIRIT